MDHATFARRYVGPWLPQYAAGVLALAATNQLSVWIPHEVARAIDALGSGDADAVLFDAGLRIGGMGALVIVVRTLSRVAFFNPGRHIEAAVKRDLFAHLLAQQPAFLSRHAPGDLVSRSSADLNNIRLLLGFGALQAVNTATAVGFAGAEMLRISPTLTAWTLLPIAIALGLTQFSVRRLYQTLHRLQADLAALSDQVLSTYQAIGTLQVYRAESAMEAQFERLNAAYLASALERAQLRTVLGPVLAVAASFDIFLLLWMGGPLAKSGDLSVGQLVAWLSLVGLLVNPLRGVSFLVQILRQAQVSLERLAAVMDPEPDRPDRPDGRPAPTAPPGIDVRRLTFCWPGRDEAALNDVSFTLAPGETLGVFGPTGSGKTTLLRCLSRLHNPPEGTVFVDGVDVRAIDLDDWRRAMTLVPQRAWLFSESIRDNVLLGAPDDGRFAPMVHAVTLDVDVAQLPSREDTVVGESGILLSGGQRQRVALARGLLRRGTRLLLLDDVLSAVDPATESSLVRLLSAPSPDRPTTVLVSHRISAIAGADHIVVLDHGRVVDQGTHAELSQRDGLYREVWTRQQQARTEEAP